MCSSPGQILCINTHPAKRYVRWDIMILHWRQWKWQTNFALLQEISCLSLASFCQSKAVLVSPKNLLIPTPSSSTGIACLPSDVLRTVLHSRKWEDTKEVSPAASVLISTRWTGSRNDSSVVVSAILAASPADIHHQEQNAENRLLLGPII